MHKLLIGLVKTFSKQVYLKKAGFLHSLVTMVKNALLPMSLLQKNRQIALCNSLLWVNEIIRCHLPIVDMNDAI